jgi:restriction endonuclease S subunit
VRLKDLGITQTGTTPDTSNLAYFTGPFPFIKPADIYENGEIDYTKDSLSDLGIQQARVIQPNSILMVCIGGSISKTGIVRQKASCNQQINVMTPYFYDLADYIFCCFRSLYFKGLVISTAPQTTLPILSKGKWELLPFPLPPLAEQQRIVERVNELMALCDTLEVEQAEANTRRQAYRASALNYLTTATTDFERATVWQPLAQGLHHVITDKQAVADLRKTILQLAVQGKLVPQDPTDEPASELLKKIEAEKKRLVKVGKIKPPKSLPPITEDEIPFALPSGWEWVRLGDVLNVINGRAYKRQEMLDKGTPLLRVGNLFTSKEWYYSDLELEPEKYIDDGDLIYAWSASFGPFIWNGGRVIYHYHIWKLNIYDQSSLYKHFAYRYLAAVTEQIKASGNGIAMIHMTKERMELLALPLPPLAEQQRIVERVNQLMALCDTLEAQLDAAQHQGQALLASLVHHVANTSTPSPHKVPCLT